MDIIVFDEFQGIQLVINGQYFDEMRQNTTNFLQNNTFNAKLILKHLLLQLDKLKKIYIKIDVEHKIRIKDEGHRISNLLKEYKIQYDSEISQKGSNVEELNTLKKKVEDYQGYLIDIENGTFFDYTPSDGHYFKSFQEAARNFKNYLYSSIQETIELMNNEDFNKETLDFLGIQIKSKQDYNKKSMLESHIIAKFNEINDLINNNKPVKQNNYFLIDEVNQKITFLGTYASLIRFLIDLNVTNGQFAKSLRINKPSTYSDFINEHFINEKGEPFSRNSFTNTFNRALEKYEDNKYNDEMDAMFEEFKMHQINSDFLKKIQ